MSRAHAGIAVVLCALWGTMGCRPDEEHLVDDYPADDDRRLDELTLEEWQALTAELANASKELYSEEQYCTLVGISAVEFDPGQTCEQAAARCLATGGYQTFLDADVGMGEEQMPQGECDATVGEYVECTAEVRDLQRDVIASLGCDDELQDLYGPTLSTPCVASLLERCPEFMRFGADSPSG
jgi:hypothetical protein